MRRMMLLLCGLVCAAPAPASAEDVCDGGRGGPGLATGPLQASLLPGQLGLARRACPRSEIFLMGDLALVVETADFYGNIRADAIVAGSWAVTERTEVFVSFEAFRFQTVISSLTARHFGTGYLSLGATQQIFTGSGVALAFAGRLVLPSSTLDQNSKPLAMDLGLNLAWAGHSIVTLHAALAFAGSVGISTGPAVPRGGVRLMVGFDIHPLRWFALVVELNTAFGYRGALDVVAPGVGFRFAIGRHVGLELGAIIPVAGEDRTLAAGALQLSWRFGGRREDSTGDDDEGDGIGEGDAALEDGSLEEEGGADDDETLPAATAADDVESVSDEEGPGEEVAAPEADASNREAAAVDDATADDESAGNDLPRESSEGHAGEAIPTD